jgi:hypothetical protein
MTDLLVGVTVGVFSAHAASTALSPEQQADVR